MRLEIVPFSEVAPVTQAAKHDHPVLWHWLPTQCWKWEGGDAICVLVQQTVWAVIRVGSKVVVVEAPGIAPALRLLGIEESIEVK
jgi:hypothetical protein